jgi:hypothetical protein
MLAYVTSYSLRYDYLRAYLLMLHAVALITVVARSKESTVFARSNTGIVGSNHTLCMEVIVRFSVLVLSCV